MHNPVDVVVYDQYGNLKVDNRYYNMRTAIGDQWQMAVLFGYNFTIGSTDCLTALAVTSNSGFSPARGDTSFTGLTTNGFDASHNLNKQGGAVSQQWTFTGASITLYGAAALAPITSATEQPVFETTFNPVITLATNDIITLTWTITLG